MCILITGAIYIFNVENKVKDTKCVFAKLPKDILNGTESNESINFIGIYGIIDMFNELALELQNFSSVESDMQSIVDSNIK